MVDLISNVFVFTAGLIFISTIIGMLIARLRKDRCLELFDKDHVTLQMSSGEVIWGDLDVFAQGLELRYDAPYQTKLGLIKSGYLLYQPELSKLLALCRYIGHLTEEERRDRERQVRRSIRPNFVRRALRKFGNLLNTIRDAFAQSISVVVGQLATANKRLDGSKKPIEDIGRAILWSGNAYEPMLERHIGKPVLLELSHPAEPKSRTIELPGFLAEYSDKFIAMFNVRHPFKEVIELAVDKETIEQEDLKILVDGDRLHITNLHDTPLVVEALITEEEHRLDIVLTNGTSARLSRPASSCTLRLLRVQYVDFICPRGQAVVRYASLDEAPIASNLDFAPLHEDGSNQFP